MLQHPKAKYLIKTFIGEGHVINIGLEYLQSFSKAEIIPVISFHWFGKINAEKISPCVFQQHLWKSPGAATHFQHIFSVEVFFIPTCFAEEPQLADLHLPLFPVYLQLFKPVPLKTKIARILFAPGNADHPISHGVFISLVVLPHLRGGGRSLFGGWIHDSHNLEYKKLNIKIN